MQAIDPRGIDTEPSYLAIKSSGFPCFSTKLKLKVVYHFRFYEFPLLPKYFKTVVNIIQVYKRGLFIFNSLLWGTRI